jgi:hypothetical protein
MVEIKSVGVVRCGIVLAVLYAIGGLIEALFIVPIMMLSPAGSPNAVPDSIRPFFGAGAIIILPIFLGVCGFIGGVIGALLYNIVARWTGGFVFRVEQVGGGVGLQ